MIGQFLVAVIDDVVGGHKSMCVKKMLSDKEKLTTFYRVKKFEIIAPYMLRVHFDDGTLQTIDFQPVLSGKLYGPLRDPSLFSQVQIDPEAHTLVWPNGADFDPATLHDWPEHVEELSIRAQSWAATTDVHSSLAVPA